MRFTESSGQLKSLNLAEGIDFYEEVKQFEIGLIKLALDQLGEPRQGPPAPADQADYAEFENQSARHTILRIN